MKTKRIEICGGIGSGKTTLADTIVKRTECSYAKEQFRENPFWNKFSANPKLFTYEKNIFFIVQHIGEIKALSNTPLLVCDYSVLQDLAYAKITGEIQHIEIMEFIYSHLYENLPHPDVLIYLDCTPEIQLNRIAKRERTEEKKISLEYLTSLNKAIKEELSRVDLSKTKIHYLNNDKNAETGQFISEVLSSVDALMQ